MLLNCAALTDRSRSGVVLCPSDRLPHSTESKPAVGTSLRHFPPLHLPPTHQPTLRWCTPKLPYCCSALICKTGREVVSQQQAAARSLLCPHGDCLVAFLERFTSSMIPKGKLLHAPRGTHSGLISLCFLSFKASLIPRLICEVPQRPR